MMISVCTMCIVMHNEGNMCIAVPIRGVSIRGSFIWENTYGNTHESEYSHNP